MADLMSTTDPAGQSSEADEVRPGPAPEVTLPPLGTVGLLRWAWRQLTSMRTALLLLLLLAVAAVPGSVFPQRRINPGQVQQYVDDHPGYAGLLDRLGFFDVYSSVWFSAIYLLLFVSLVGCVLPRSRAHLKALRAAPPRTPRRLERLPGHERRTVAAPAPEVLDALARELRGRRYRIARHDDVSVSAERGYLAESGNLVFHLALLGLLAGVAAGSLYGYSGQVLVVEGQSFSNAVPYYDSFTAGSRVDTGSLSPFSLTLDRMRVRFDDQGADAGTSQFGAPRQFDADMTVTDAPGDAPRKITVSPNNPLDVGGVRAFLVGNGYAPHLTVKGGDGKVAFSGAVPFLATGGNYKSVGVVKVPYAQPRQIAVTGFFLPTYYLDPQQGPSSLFPDSVDPKLAVTVYVSKPGQDALATGANATSVYALDTSSLTQLTKPDGDPLNLLVDPGATVQLPDGAGTVTFDGLRRYAVLDVRYDPSKVWVLAAALAALAGVTASLFVRRRRLWVRVSADGEGRTVVEAAGLSRGEDAGLKDEVSAVLAAAPDAQQPQGTTMDEPPAGRQEPQHVEQE
ncbi:MAG TPA: cytochrome c biogenesis protein ResB [Kineosporiaceae bacterium]|nr:cytochrome c biogenesis protein ResB [Kineosporiaceae bacterium]